MEIGIAAGANSSLLATSLAEIYAAANMAAQIVLLPPQNTIQNSLEIDDNSCKKPFDILLLNADYPTSATGRTMMLSTDQGDNHQALRDFPCGHNVVSYGLNRKSCITASSLCDDQLVICLQRAIPCFGGHMAEPMEFAIRRAPGGPGEQLLLAVVATALCGGVPPEAISAFFEKAAPMPPDLHLQNEA